MTLTDPNDVTLGYVILALLSLLKENYVTVKSLKV